jgi:hypothetical protein
MNKLKVIVAASMIAGALLSAVAVRAQQGTETRARPADTTGPPMQRYLLSVWSHSAGINNTGGPISPTHGAYIIDTQSGKVWHISEDGAPKPIGSAKD